MMEAFSDLGPGGIFESDTACEHESKDTCLLTERQMMTLQIA